MHIGYFCITVRVRALFCVIVCVRLHSYFDVVLSWRRRCQSQVWNRTARLTIDRANDSFLLKRRPVLGGGVAELPAGDDDAGAAAVLVTPVQFPRRLLIFLRPTLLPPPCRCTGGSVSPRLAHLVTHARTVDPILTWLPPPLLPSFFNRVSISYPCTAANAFSCECGLELQ